MTSVTVFTAERMQEIEDTAVVSGRVEEDGMLILVRYNGDEIEAGLVSGIPVDMTLDDEEYTRSSDTPTPLTLTPGAATTISDSFMVDSSAEPEWGHWDGALDQYVFDKTGLYYIIAYAEIDSSGTGTGASSLTILGSQESAASEFDHISGSDARLTAQITALYEEGDTFHLSVKCSAALDLIAASFEVQKYNITAPISASGGLEAGATYLRYTDAGTMPTLVPNFVTNLTDIFDAEEVGDGFLWDDSLAPANAGVKTGKTCLYEIGVTVILDSNALTTGQAELWIDPKTGIVSVSPTQAYGSGVNMKITHHATLFLSENDLIEFRIKSTEAVDVVEGWVEMRRLSSYP